ncbi:GHMP family kinase ATP-binding protein [Methanocalculus sp. MC3]
MPASVKAFSPGHISGYFSRIMGETPEDTGSIGAGLVLSQGVTATVERSKETEVLVVADGVETIGSPPIEEALERIGVRALVRTESLLPIGSGFGLSAASLLATIIAADELFSLSMGMPEIARLAHEIEVMHGNGLGDVAAELGGGLVCRTAPGIGGVAHRLPVHDEQIAIISLSPISTQQVLSSPESMKRVALAYPGRCPADINDFFSLSRQFAEASGLITDPIRSILSACDDANLPASMTMLGEGVFAFGEESEAVLSQFGKVYVTSVADEGPIICEVKQ